MSSANQPLRHWLQGRPAALAPDRNMPPCPPRQASADAIAAVTESTGCMPSITVSWPRFS